jgi:FAD:protein FMN transferase
VTVRVEHVMGIPVVVEVPDPPDGAIDAVFEWLRDVDRRFSPYREDSEVARIARGELAARDAHRDIRRVLACCERLRAATGGCFDAWAGGRLDPSGLVKGWAVDRGAVLLGAAGARRYLINAGGDVRAGGGPWRVGIQHPRRRDRIAAVLELTDGGVATSGTYERGGHIVDPRTGQPARGALSVTVAGPDLATADAYATAAFVMGEGGVRWLAAQRGYAGLAILPADRVLATAGFGRYVGRRGGGRRERERASEPGSGLGWGSGGGGGGGGGGRRAAARSRSSARPTA